MATVIVFGPTGAVGSTAALTASSKNAKVVLAMRDPKKQISGLDETSGAFERVQADLTQPDTVAEAVRKTGATRAFIYAAHTGDGMKATITALKEAGVTFVVFLSSFTVRGEKEAIQPADMIAYMHARVEVSLDEVFGEANYVALRPGGFVTNVMMWKKDILKEDVRMYAPGFELDCITPGDMGRVAGTVLVDGPKGDQRKVYLYGPKMVSLKDIVVTIGKVLGKDVKVTEIEADEALEQFKATGFPEPIAKYLVAQYGKGSDGWKRTEHEQGIKNVEVYTGKPSTGVVEWTEQNKDLFI